MIEVTTILAALLAVYLSLAAFLYIYQRKLIYFPTPADPNFVVDEITINNDGMRLHGWVLNPGRPRALIYFGGNSELITHRSGFFRDVFGEYSVYLINYRGYGYSEGSPSETALFSDALAIYDQLLPRHETISAYGRSLGSGVAVFLAAERALEKLILLTPYDSITEVARKAYPYFPVRLLLKDRFDSAARAADIDEPVLITSAEFDHEIKLPHTLALKRRLTRARLTYRMIAGAAHNNIVDFSDYRETVRDFIRPQP